MVGCYKTCTQVGMFGASLQFLENLGSLVVEATYLSCVSATSFHSTDSEMATIVHRTCGTHPKFFVA